MGNGPPEGAESWQRVSLWPRRWVLVALAALLVWVPVALVMSLFFTDSVLISADDRLRGEDGVPDFPTGQFAVVWLVLVAAPFLIWWWTRTRRARQGTRTPERDHPAQ